MTKNRGAVNRIFTILNLHNDFKKGKQPRNPSIRAWVELAAADHGGEGHIIPKPLARVGSSSDDPNLPSCKVKSDGLQRPVAKRTARRESAIQVGY